MWTNKKVTQKLCALLVLMQVNEYVGSQYTRKSRKSCTLPEHPDNGKLSTEKERYFPSEAVPEFTVIHLNCARDFVNVGYTSTVCVNGTWNQPVGECTRACPPIKTTSHTSYKCKHGDYEISCSEATTGTVATFQCDDFYETTDSARTVPFVMCVNGSWDSPPPKCVPVCGQTHHSRDYPWHVGVYELRRDDAKEFLCGGSLISRKLVLTAATCVTESNGVKKPIEVFTVAAGKRYRSYYDPRDSLAQFSSLSQVAIPVEYKGAHRFYFGDIAILVTQEMFTLSRLVLPVCFNWRGDIASTNGKVIVWGLSSEGQLFEQLRELEVPHVPANECLEALPRHFDVYLTSDKFCGEQVDKSVTVCKGDGGGGLVSKYFDDRYYIEGVLSLSPLGKNGECGNTYHGLYTNISKYRDFVYKTERFSSLGLLKP